MNNFIIILGAGVNQLPFVIEANNQGFRTIVFDIEKKSAADRADIFYQISIYETDKILVQLKKLNYTYSAIIARVTSAQGLFTARIIAKEYNLVFASQTLIELGTNKSFLANFCEENNILIPKTKTLKKFDEIKTLVLQDNSTYIIKPSMTKIGKKHIIKFQTIKELENIFQSTSSVSDNQEVLVQDYIEGTDVAVFTIFEDNSFKIVATLDEINSFDENNNVKAIGLQTPSTLLKNESLIDKISMILKKFNQVLPNEKYFIAFAFRIDSNNDVYLIEVHTDLTGDLVMDKLLPTANPDFNFFNLFIKFLTLQTDMQKEYIFKDMLLIFDDKIYIKPTDLTTLEIKSGNITFLNNLKEIDE